MSFGKNLQYLRQLSANMTQETLADASGVNRIMIARYETTGANMTVETAQKLADALGCTIDALFEKGE
jgi:transcriptional regulator with XRE-family HTH domain